MAIERNPAASQRQRVVAAAACREQAATHLHLALVQLEAAIALMPTSRDRQLMDRALGASLLAYRECTRNLCIARAQLAASTIPLSPTLTAPPSPSLQSPPGSGADGPLPPAPVADLASRRLAQLPPAGPTSLRRDPSAPTPSRPQPGA